MRLGLTDTIAAVSTAPGESGIGIIRISGEDSFLIADKVLDRKISDKETHTIHFRHAVKEGRVLDEVLVSVMRAPRSYTGENTAEINCHGGTLVVQQVLEEVLRAGARLAEPGEFTKRAFLNGKKDLSQAEAVMDVIQARLRKLQSDFYLRDYMVQASLSMTAVAATMYLQYPAYRRLSGAGFGRKYTKTAAFSY